MTPRRRLLRGSRWAISPAVPHPRKAERGTSLTLLVCRGCCCGTQRKHPDVDHEAQLASLESAAQCASGMRVLAVGCLEECSRSNVVVLRFRTATETTTRWLGEMLDPQKTEALCKWMTTGGPESGRLPASLALAEFAPGHDAVCAVDRLEQD